MKKLLIAAIALLFACNFAAKSQSGASFLEFSEKLEPYFDPSLIQDIRKELPQGVKYTIWGWAVGDFSGDGYNDVAFTARFTDNRSREVQVYLFVDIDGFLKKVGDFPFKFVELPLEIGFDIKNTTCYVTKKRQQFDWMVYGYTFDNGVLVKKDIFTTMRVGDLTHERYRNFISMKGSERYIKTKTGEEVFKRDFLSVPSYRRGKIIYKGFSDGVFTNYIDYVHEGAYYWEGSDDCSYRVSSAYDDEYLYFTVDVADDAIVNQSCDTCIADHIQGWFDVNKPGPGADRFSFLQNGNIKFRNSSDSGLYNFTIYPGDFLEKQAYVKLSTNSELSAAQKLTSRDIKAISNLTDNGYIVKFKIPLDLLNLNLVPEDGEQYSEIGCTFIVTDYDNEFRPDEMTEIATSAFSSLNPSTYGSLIIVPESHWYGEAQNIYRDEIIRLLKEYGY
jgi:hypothetical protein